MKGARRQTLTAGGESTCNLCRSTFSASSAELFVKDGHTIVRCPACGLVFRAKPPHADTLAELYSREYFAGGAAGRGGEGYLDYVGDAEMHRLNARRRLRHLATLVEPGALLDVGCAAGFFVDEAVRAGWDARGVDVSETVVAWANAHVRADIRRGTLDDVPADRLESCITMWDYIEHALDPRADVEQAFARLRPGGILALSTGDADSLLARLSLERWHLMTPRVHNFFFSSGSLRGLLESTGFEVLDVRHPASVYPIRYLAHKARLTVDVPLLEAIARRLARSRLGARTVPFNLWDVMTVIARRPAARGTG